MGGAGLDVDMVTGRPLVKDQAVKEAEVRARYQESTREAVELALELQNSPVLRLLLKKYRARLVHLASLDPECQALTGVIGSLRYTLEVAPREAGKVIHRLMGPQMSSFIQEEPEEELQSAPEGIPD